MKNYSKAFKQTDDFKQDTPSYEIEDETIIDNVEEDNEIEHDSIEVDSNPTYIGTVSGAAKVYMRSEASKESDHIEILDEGIEVEVVDDSDPKWYKVCNSAGVEGFIMKDFITI